jgi:hypothetical protein
MKLLIDIPEHIYEHAKEGSEDSRDEFDAMRAIANGSQESRSEIPNTCGDAISRQAVDDAIYDYSRSCDVNYQQIMEFIDKIPPANPQESKTDILDKIEAEIGQAFLDDKAMQEHTVKKCLGIIDKYKGERKG